MIQYAMVTGSLWRDRDFTLFWLVQTLSVAGDSFSYVALPLLMLRATGSVSQMGLLTGLAGAATIVAGVFAGTLADRIDRRMLLIVCDVARAGLYALIPLVWLFSPQIWLLYAIVPLSAAFAMVFRVSYVAAVTNLVDPHRITEANARLSATYAAASVGGPVIAGVLCGLYGPTSAIAVDAATFAVSAVGLCFVRLRVRTPARDVPAPDGVSWRDFVVGVRFLWRHPVLRALTVLLSFLTFLTLGLTDIVVYYLGHELRQSDGTVGYVLATAAVGTIIAAFVVAPARRTLGFGACWIGSYALCGVAIAGIGMSRSVPVVAALATTVVFGIGVAGICSMSLRQEVTPDHLLGRVTASFWTIHSALGPIGAAVLTTSAAHYGVPATCLVAGVACLLIAACGTLTPIRQARPERLAVEVP
ncbi:MFS transporter [Phytohabitans kaempferiae]|uniref:MFS transporter n=1 Tax=Phytohabitans kaempferiae TaxID=1620943 RepID=A0ABV6MBU8_9ACTN